MCFHTNITFPVFLSGMTVCAGVRNRAVLFGRMRPGEGDSQMTKRGKKILKGIGLMALLALFASMTVLAADGSGEEYVPAMYATFAALVPPIVAIVLALITKEV